MAKRANRHYSPAEKSAFVAEVERLYRAGNRTYASIARELGIYSTSYHTWLSQGIKATPTAAAPLPLRRVEVTALVPTVTTALTLLPPKQVASTHTLTLVAPGGYRIEGLGIETAAQLLRALS